MKFHQHCPDECQHEQSFTASLPIDNAWDYPNLFADIEYEFCGRCWFRFKDLIPMMSCTNKLCVWNYV